MFDIDADPAAFLAWLDDVGEADPPPPEESPDFSSVGTVDPPELSDAGLLNYLAHLSRQVARLQAVQQQVLSAIADADGSVEGWSAEPVALLLRVPSRTAQRMLAVGQTLVRSLPRTLAALSAGLISLRHAEVVAEAAWQLPDQVLPELEQRCLRHADTQTPSQFRAVTRRALIALDPRTAQQRHRAARADRCVQLRPAEDGMSELRALLPAPDAELLYRHLSDATRLLPAADPRTRDQQRADLLVDAVLCGIPHDALPKRHGRRPSINVMVPAATLLRQNDDPGWIDGYGPITADHARELAGDQTGTWRRIITDPVHNQVLDYGTTSYRPPQPLADHVIARDPVCVFPSCSQPAYRTDLDHIQPFNRGGPTNADNLAPLCRRHHIAKTRGLISYTRNADGTHTWTDQYDNTYLNYPLERWEEPPPEP